MGASLLALAKSIYYLYAFLTWHVTYLQVVPLHYINPLPDTCVNTCLVWQMSQRCVVSLYYDGVFILEVMLPLSKGPDDAQQLPFVS